MKIRMMVLGAAVAAMSTTAFAQAQHKQSTKHAGEQAKACGDLSTFRASVDKLRSAGPETTVGEIKQDARQARENLKKFEKSASKVAKPETENVRKSVERLQKDAQSIPNNATAAQARAQIESDVEQVRMASNQLEQKLNCGYGGAGMGGAGMGGMDAGTGGAGMGGMDAGTGGGGTFGGMDAGAGGGGYGGGGGMDAGGMYGPGEE